MFRLTFPLRPTRRKTARITLAFGGGVFLGDQERNLSRAYLNEMLLCLTRIDILYLQAYPQTPRFADSGVLYREEPPGQEDWQDIPTCLHMGIADCEDLACWIAAERTVRDGIPSRAVGREFEIEHPDGKKGVMYHIIVERSDGVVEDPSKMSGMG